MNTGISHLEILLPVDAKTVYETLLDKSKVCLWRVPEGMECDVHEFQSAVGGRIRISLRYTDSTQVGKTSEHTDTYEGYFKELSPYEKIVEVDQFISESEHLNNSMTITYRMKETERGTLLTVLHEGLPESISPEINTTGWEEALQKLKKLVVSK